jgi:hypothetical protein
MSRIGIAGTDENKRIAQAQRAMEGRFGIAGLNDRTIIGAGRQASFGVAGLNQVAKCAVAGPAIAGTGQASFGVAGLDRTAKCAVAGPNTRPIVASAKSAMGIAGNLGGGARVEIADSLVDVAAFKRRDDTLAGISRDSNRMGDRAARDGWKRGVWFADFTYVCTPYEATGNGGYAHNGALVWRNGREAVFGRQGRDLPLFIDSCGYRRAITGTAPAWARPFDVYPAAIELLDPDGYAAWDDPHDRGRTLDALRELMALFPNDVANRRMWPVFSLRWTWDDDAHLDFARLPGWAGKSLAYLIPLNRTQRQFNESTRERWARQAIANALVMAQDPDFRQMIDTFGRVMIGGMVGSKCPRMARHLFAATLCSLFPGVHFWLLGQANFAVTNGLGMLGLLDQVWLDGSWWIKDATAERFAIVEDGLITMLSLESNHRMQSFFTLIEMMAANLRSLLAAYEGMWSWPPPEPLPVDLLDVDQAIELKTRLQAAQMELGL